MRTERDSARHRKRLARTKKKVRKRLRQMRESWEDLYEENLFADVSKYYHWKRGYEAAVNAAADSLLNHLQWTRHWRSRAENRYPLSGCSCSHCAAEKYERHLSIKRLRSKKLPVDYAVPREKGLHKLKLSRAEKKGETLI